MASDSPPPSRQRGRPHKRSAATREWIRFREDGDRKRRFQDAVLELDPFGDMSATLRAYISYFVGDTDEIPPRPEPNRSNPG